MPSAAASIRYSASSAAMYTPPVSSTANELLTGERRSVLRVRPLAGSTVTTLPRVDTTQIRPDQSGIAAMSLSSRATSPLRS